jgi:hypothetical protein
MVKGRWKLKWMCEQLVAYILYMDGWVGGRKDERVLEWRMKGWANE